MDASPPHAPISSLRRPPPARGLVGYTLRAIEQDLCAGNAGQYRWATEPRRRGCLACRCGRYEHRSTNMPARVLAVPRTNTRGRCLSRDGIRDRLPTIRSAFRRANRRARDDSLDARSRCDRAPLFCAAMHLPSPRKSRSGPKRKVGSRDSNGCARQ